MSDLPKIQQELRAALPKKGISFLIKSLKGLLPEGTPKYDILIALEAEYRQLKLDTFGGVLSAENKVLRESQLRKRILDLVSSLEDADFDTDTEHSILADKQQIRRGHVLYRIPQEMQLQEESRCLVRIAFDKAMIVEDLDLNEDTELRSEVRISDYMKVEIEDPSAEGVFAIRTTSEEIQFIDEDDFTEWHFYVKPLVSGKHRLELKVSVILRINGEDRVREKTLEESVVVITEPVAKGDGNQVLSQLEEAFIVSDAPVVDVFNTLESAVLHPPMMPPMVEPSTVFVNRNAPGAPVPPAPAPTPAPSARKAKSKGSLVRNLSLVLVLCLGFGFAFNLLTNDNTYTGEDNPGDISVLAPPDKGNLSANEQEASYVSYLEANPYGPEATEALWQLAQLTQLPEDYLAYVNNLRNMGFFPTPEDEYRMLQAQKTYFEMEQGVWDKISTTPNPMNLDRYLRLYPEGRFREIAISQLADAETWNNTPATNLPQRWQSDTLNWQYRLLSYAEEGQTERERQLIKRYANSLSGTPEEGYYDQPRITAPESTPIKQ